MSETNNIKIYLIQINNKNIYNNMYNKNIIIQYKYNYVIQIKIDLYNFN